MTPFLVVTFIQIDFVTRIKNIVLKCFGEKRGFSAAISAPGMRNYGELIEALMDGLAGPAVINDSW
jgi:hypothetical protein